MRAKWLILLFIALITGIPGTFSQDSSRNRNVNFSGYIKDLNIIINQDALGGWVYFNMVHSRLNFKWYITPDIIITAEARNRFFTGKKILVAALTESLKEDNGFIDMNFNILKKEGLLFNSTIDRLNLDINRGKYQFTAGRQRINWGQTFAWNPNDIFNIYSYFDFDYEEKPGSDALRLQYYPDISSRFDLAVKAGHDSNITCALLYAFNRRNYDFQVLGGLFDQDIYVAGAGWSGQLFKGGFRGEASYFHPVNHFTDTTGTFVASVGYDYTTKKSVFLQFEVLYNGNRDTSVKSSINSFNENAMNASNPFLDGFSFFGAVSYPFSPILNGSISGIYNPDNSIFIIIPVFTASVSDNFDLSALLQSFQSYDSQGQDLKGNFIFLRLKWSF